MNRISLFLANRARGFVAASALLFMLMVVCAASHPVRGQRMIEAPKTVSADDNDYTRKIKEYTTEPYFRTELVDHLPMSDKVPSPDKVLGYIVGTPNKLTYSKDLYRYYRELARTSNRVRLFTAPEKSEEGKEQILVAVGETVVDRRPSTAYEIWPPSSCPIGKRFNAVASSPNHAAKAIGCRLTE